MRELLTAKNVCAKGKFHRSSFYRLMALGLMPAPLKFGASSRWDAAEIDAAIQALADRRKPKPQPMEIHDDERQP